MSCIRIRKAAVIAALAGAATMFAVAASATAPEGFFELKNRVEYTLAEVPDAEREATLKALAEEMNTLAEQHPDNAEVLVWQGLVLAAYAGERRSFGALGDAKAARRALERAIKLDPKGNNGSAYVTLGILYARVPGGLISFGDSEKADRMFQRALEIRPDGIDVNYYYATILADEDRTQAAREHARRAVNGTPRPARQDSDEALREDARSLLDTL
ncbi:hypothetical protein GCM10022228_06100 [Halomonas cibimaris]|uniref:Tetratricopeptide repeat protein n=1 Tax=Halomonas cibimaris TaxID=657012 RepID=A0ABP7LET0_9GAMM